MTEDHDPTDFSDEDASRHVARTLMYMTAGKSSSVIDHFLTWLLAGAGATFGLVISNLDKLSPYISVSSVRSGAALFLIGAVLAAIEKYIASVVIGSADAVEAASKFSSETYEQFPDLRMEIIRAEFESVTLPVTRALKRAFYFIFGSRHPAHNAAKAAQIQAHIALVSIACILGAVSIIALGLQV
jgi:hypothetical protein